MPYLIINALLILLMLLSPGCSQKAARTKSWSIQLTTSGGFAGIGNGNLSADSEGRIIYEKPAPRSAQPSRCEGRLEQGELASLGAAVAQLKSERWDRPELNRPAPDAFHYTLVLESGEKSSKVSWFDNTVDQLPSDLRELNAKLRVLMQKQSRNCDGR